MEKKFLSSITIDAAQLKLRPRCPDPSIKRDFYRNIRTSPYKVNGISAHGGAFVGKS